MRRVSAVALALALLGLPLPNTSLAAEQAGIAPETVTDYLHAVIEAHRTFYTIHVVERLQKDGMTTAAENWRSKKNTLPLPVQFLMESNELAMKTGARVNYRLITLWPINPLNASIVLTRSSDWIFATLLFSSSSIMSGALTTPRAAKTPAVSVISCQGFIFRSDLTMSAEYRNAAFKDPSSIFRAMRPCSDFGISTPSFPSSACMTRSRSRRNFAIGLSTTPAQRGPDKRMLRAKFEMSIS